MRQLAANGWQQVSQLAARLIGAQIARLWGNPMLKREREARPLPLKAIIRWLLPSAGALMLLPILTWVFDFRLGSAISLAVTLASALIPALVSPIVSASIVPQAREEAAFTALSREDAAWGSALLALWRLRWLLIVSLTLLPAFLVSVLRLDVAAFSAYHDTVLALGSAAPPEQVRLLLPGGGIPYFRLLLRAISASLLPTAYLPLASALGVSAALALDDVTFGQIGGLVGALVSAVAIGLVWNWVSMTPLLGGLLEAIRLLALAGLLAGLLWLADRASSLNARRLLK